MLAFLSSSPHDRTQALRCINTFNSWFLPLKTCQLVEEKGFPCGESPQLAKVHSVVMLLDTDSKQPVFEGNVQNASQYLRQKPGNTKSDRIFKTVMI